MLPGMDAREAAVTADSFVRIAEDRSLKAETFDQYCLRAVLQCYKTADVVAGRFVIKSFELSGIQVVPC